MNLKRMIPMYNCNDMYLYEILEDYKYAEDISEKDAIFDAFCSALWSCGNNRTRMTKTIRYRVRNDLINTETGKIFDAYKMSYMQAPYREKRQPHDVLSRMQARKTA